MLMFKYTMSLPGFENFLFVPHGPDTGTGDLYELEERRDFAPDSFVLLPYSNPAVKEPAPVFFRIKSRYSTNLQQYISLASGPSAIRLKQKLSQQEYLLQISKLREHIQKGDIYEINYCVALETNACEIDPVSVFLKLHALARAPYAALLKWGDSFILSASPELFLKKQGDVISTKPIKGTIRRGTTPEEDAALKAELQQSLKERTENVMAVDVARNDLSMFAEKGSVSVNRLYNIETFETVHQMVSTVSCRLKKHTSFEKILRSTFPMASMTGAPKQRAMDLIDRYEVFERGCYSGAMGLIDAKGDYTLSVIIRSIFYNQNAKTIRVAVGGAITYLSDPEKEYEECLLKANGLLRALNAGIV